MSIQTPIWAETLGIRARGWSKTVIRLAGIALVLLGVYNMFLTALFDLPAFAPYRQWGMVFNTASQAGYYVGDVLVMCVGAIVAWFV